MRKPPRLACPGQVKRGVAAVRRAPLIELKAAHIACCRWRSAKAHVARVALLTAGGIAAELGHQAQAGGELMIQGKLKLFGLFL